MMTSRERVKRVFQFEIPDRIPIYDLVQKGVYPEGDFDIALLNDVNIKKPEVKDKFKMKPIMDPFEDISCALGLEYLLERIAKEPESVGRTKKESGSKL